MRDWNSIVEDCREAAQQMAGHQWRIADDALEATVLSAGKDAETETFKAVLERFAEDVGIVSLSTLSQYRDVAASWPVEHRQPSVSWTVHRELRHHENRYELIRKAAVDKWTVSRARREAGLKAFANLTPQTPAEKLDKIKEWMKEANVQDAIDNDTAYELYQHIGDRDQAVVEKHWGYGRNVMGGNEERWTSSYYIDKATNFLRMALQELKDTDMSEEERQVLLSDLEKHDLAAGWLRSRLTEGRAFDAELESLLSGEAM